MPRSLGLDSTQLCKANELINIFALAMQADIPAGKLKHALFGYPSLSSDVKFML